MSELIPCIITVLDLIGTRSLAASGKASKAMMHMHDRAAMKINHGLPLHRHGYVWNDSVLLLSYETTPDRRGALLNELSDFKRWLEEQCGAQFYAISVKGQAFPQNPIISSVFDGQISGQPRAIVLKTSSWAMANCFAIEKELGKHRADWYIDSRITNAVDMSDPFACESVELLPSKEPRKINMYRGDLIVYG